MQYLEKESSSLYFDLTRYAFHECSLSWIHFLARMSALRNMCDPMDRVYEKANRILLVEELNDEDDWSDEGQEEFYSSQEEGAQGIDEKRTIQPGLSQDESGYLQFLSRKKGLTNWVFHQYDADFHPSIPHGHFQGNKQPKLDCYLGWVYKGSKQVKRLKRNLIIELWNDEDFRFFAYNSIEWYMIQFPKFNWRVRNPLRLPRWR